MTKLLTLFALISICFSGAAQNLSELTVAGNLEAVKALIEKNKTLVNQKDKEGDIQLCTSILRGHSELSLFYIDNGADLNNQNMDGFTPLHWAAIRGDRVIAEALIKKGANINIQNKEGDTPLNVAGMRGNSDFAQCMLKHGAELELSNNYKRTPLLMAARERGGIEMIRILVEGGANINAHDIFGDTPLSLSAWRGFEEIVDYLLEKGAKFSTDRDEGMKLLAYAADKRLLKFYKALIKSGGEKFLTELKEQPVLHRAAEGGSPEITEDLINRGFKPNDVDSYQWTPLHYASYFGRAEAASLLIKHGADINAKTPLGESPLYLARLENKSEVVDLLLSAGIDQSPPGPTSLSGQYMGQKAPGEHLELFAPGIVSRLKGGHSNITFSPDGNMAFWTEWILTDVGYSAGCTVWYSKVKDGVWTLPMKFLTKGDTPFFLADGNRIFFLSSFPMPPENEELRGIWYFERGKDSLIGPKHLNFDLNSTGLYWQFSFDKNQNIYFSTDEGLFRCIYQNGEYLDKENLSDIFHPDYKGGAPYVSPEGDYIIFSSMNLPGSFGSLDLYIGYKKPDGTWTAPINMGPSVNSSSQEHLPLVTAEGKYLFMRTQRNGINGIYWIDANIINELRLITP